MPARTSLNRIKQIAIPVYAIETARDFYRDVLGMRHLFDAPPALSFFDCGGIRLMLAGPDGQGKDAPHQHPVLFYDVSDIKSVFAQIKSAGAEAIEEPHIVARVNGQEVWLAAVSDGQGNVVSLMNEVPEK